MLSLGSAACICRHCRRSTNIIDYLSWKLDVYIYICTQVIDKRSRQRAREREREKESCFVFAYTINERRTRAKTDRFRYLCIEEENDQSILFFSIISDNDQLG
jgi:hypothetical protein